MALPPLVRTSQKELDGAHAEVREASARAARLEVRIAELETRLAAIEAEINQTQTEPLPPLSPERERCACASPVAGYAAPLYRHSISRVRARPGARPSRDCWSIWTC